MAKKGLFAILVLNYNGKKYLKDFFESLFDCINIERSGVYLIDNNSSDDSIAFVKKKYPSVEIIQTGDNLGFSGAYNLAHHYLAHNKHCFKYYFIVNNDVLFMDKNIFVRSFEVMEGNNEIGILSPTILNKNKRIELQGGDYIFISGTTFGYGSGKYYKPMDKLFTSKWASGCACFVRENIFDEVGGFDNYFMYQEDVGLSWKVVNKNYKILADGLSSIVHLGGGTSKESIFEHYYSERNRLILYKQNLSTISFVLILPLFLLMRLILLLKQGNINIAKAKAKGLKDGFVLLPKFPKNNRSFINDFRTIIKFHQRQNIVS